MSERGPVTESEARAIIAEWARLHDLQAGLSAFLPIIAEEGFSMRFGDKEWRGYADFEDHQITKRKIFDEVHDDYDIQVEVGPEKTVAKTRLRWFNRYRPERSPRSRVLKAYLEHTWEFRRCPRMGRAFMQGHTVDHFVYEKGFGPGDEQAYDPHLDPRWGTR
jgi:hypothetical protein